MARSERRLGAQYQTEISDSDDRDMERCAWSNELNGRLYRWLPFPMEIPATCDEQINRGRQKIGVSSAKKARRFTICLTIYSLVLLWFNSCLDFYSWSRKTKNETLTDKGPINYAPLYVMYTVIISTGIQYSVATYNIGQRFVRLNSSLKSMLDTNNSNNDDAIGYFRKFSERGK